MGNTQSEEPLPDDFKPILEYKDLEGVANYIKSGGAKKIIVMSGAELDALSAHGIIPGISTSAGIPDFRSPGTGLYDNLEKLNLPYPQAVFDIQFFRQNPLPFYTLAQGLSPSVSNCHPTPAHTFVRLLHKHGLLHKCFTQNIDTLERKAGIPESKLVEAHGSFADQHCIDCGARYSDEKMKKCLDDKSIPKCERPGCGGLVKPDIVFFGESLPPSFQQSLLSLGDADLLIIMGTSLTVQPFARLPSFVPHLTCPRVLINRDPAGDIGSRPDDVVVLEDCDKACRRLSMLLGWGVELEDMWVEIKGESGKEKKVEGVDELTERMGKELHISKEEPKAEEKDAKKVARDDVEKVATPAKVAEAAKKETTEGQDKKPIAGEHVPESGSPHFFASDVDDSDELYEK